MTTPTLFYNKQDEQAPLPDVFLYFVERSMSAAAVNILLALMLGIGVHPPALNDSIWTILQNAIMSFFLVLGWFLVLSIIVGGLMQAISLAVMSASTRRAISIGAVSTSVLLVVGSISAVIIYNGALAYLPLMIFAVVINLRYWLQMVSRHPST
ncbi:MAG: hypothetical protein AAF125_21905 [Chloroflexota bacterium]